jgi:endonuclease YncB( thermonuclease family)
MKSQKEILILVLCLVLLITLNYTFLDTKLEGFLIENNYEIVEVERVVDGDTAKINGSSVRLLGINTPEKGEKYSSEATEFLEKLSLNKSLKKESKGFDLYKRELVYLFEGNKNINLEIVKEGYANYYFPSGKDIYYNDFVYAWENCIKENKNLCEKSLDKCGNCISIKSFEGQEVVFENVCNFDCDLTNWEIKDEGRKKFIFENLILKSEEEVEITEKDFDETYVWTSSGDTLFLRDTEGKLVLWEGY